MIATARVLRVRARDPFDVAQAARAVVAYVQGGADPLARYYGGQAIGRACGAGAELVGLRGEVSGLALERLLRGKHAVTGRPLLGASGSAGRVRRPAAGPAGRLAAGEDREWLTLAEAGLVAGVSAAYLRSLVKRTSASPTARASLDGSSGGASAAGEERVGDVADAARRSSRRRADDLVGTRRSDGAWLVRREDLMRWCAQRTPPATVLGFDVVCAAPKSVSLLWAFGDEAMRADVAAAFDAAVDATIRYLERHAVFGMVGGENRRAVGLAVASYLHELSRNDEAHLHIHNIVINAVAVPADPPGTQSSQAGWEWRAVDGEVLLATVKTAGYVGAAVLRQELSARRGIVWEPARRGVAEIAGFPADLLAAFSTRSGQVADEFAQLVAQGLEPSAATAAAAKRSSRAPKRVLADDQVRALQAEKLTAAGYTVDQVRRLAPALSAPTPQRRQVHVGEGDIEALFARLTGAVGLTEHATTFLRRDVVQQVAGWAGDWLGAEEIERLADRFLADQRVVLLQQPEQPRHRREPEPLYTVEGMLAAEEALLASYRQGQVSAGAAPRLLVAPEILQAWLRTAASPGGPAGSATAPGGGRDEAPVLAAEQVELVRRLLTSGDLVRLAVGPAGTGKTEAMRALTGVLRAVGRTVLATAHGGRQAEELAERIGIPARVVAGWLTLLDNLDEPADVWPAGSVLIVDEATQVSTRDAERLLRYATRTGTVVILLGDPAQLGSVAAGGWFRHLVEQTPDVPALATVHRQAGPEMAPVRAALAALRADTAPAARAALERLAATGRIHVADTADSVLDRAVADWYAERQRRIAPTAARSDRAGRARRGSGETTPARPVMVQMMAERHRDVDALNQTARALLTADGTLTGPALTVAGRQFQVGDEVITLTQAGHTLVPAGKPRSAYIRTGTLGVIAAIHLDTDDPAEQAVTVAFPNKGWVRVPWEYLTWRFDDGRDGGLGHAYAITAAKAQGTTMDTARAIVPDDTSRAGLYVMLSRARTDLHAYVLRRDQLDDRDDDESWLPAGREPGDPLDRLADRLGRSQPERLATEHDPDARVVHELRRLHTLAELAAQRLAGTARPRASAGRVTAPPSASGASASPADAANDGTDRAGLPSQVLWRRAELAAEAALRAAALAKPPSTVVDRIGPRPPAGPDRAIWDDAVAALAIYRARCQPLGDIDNPEPPRDTAPDDRQRDPWLRHHDQAVHLAQAWTAALPERTRARFHSPAESVPRDRAVAGLHALLDHGQAPADLAAALGREPLTGVRAGAPVLADRVTQLCEAARVDPAAYELPAPHTALQEWANASGRLATAEANHLATRPTAVLHAEGRSLAEQLHGSTGLARAEQADAATSEFAQARFSRLNAALDHQVSAAVLRVTAEPTGYLTAMLGPRPPEPGETDAWDAAAQRIEHYRHHHLGLPLGTPAMTSPDPTRAALGDRPHDPQAAHAYDHAADMEFPIALTLGF
ncbi:MobF family relaxase [Pseudofrankia sp. DC12]|uniref:MobF family relaxase n=1 Tax=Pseudofrankia sp. DC12 TaxID=683315 RepID=UPI0005F7F4CB|nr:MobF family relaxase [Pseudofrankia sp. DC12]